MGSLLFSEKNVMVRLESEASFSFAQPLALRYSRRDMEIKVIQRELATEESLR